MSQLRSIRIDGPRSRITIGRANSSHVVLSDPLVSRAHAVVERIGEQWLIRDLGSRNGTYVNGMRVGRATSLRAGDVVQVAETRLQVLSGTSDDSMQTQALPPCPTQGCRPGRVRSSASSRPGTPTGRSPDDSTSA